MDKGSQIKNILIYSGSFIITHFNTPNITRPILKIYLCIKKLHYYRFYHTMYHGPHIKNVLKYTCRFIITDFITPCITGPILQMF